ncbi:expressed unknown protein [Ectocarpus siliculosus]|uniref:Uncharacterized protein n=1 Tax=Ectocarpus siliculosus TaxID=2880 RepID=D7FJ67_ECTSI|nr:expressed unknown protein [Ectocarpus siliculosus]|eukprot:CBJ28977.1 expressed unknown protein [Ectocarpus siliculosus]
MQASAEYLLFSQREGATDGGGSNQRPSAADDSSKSFNAVPGGVQTTNEERRPSPFALLSGSPFLSKRPAASHRS